MIKYISELTKEDLNGKKILLRVDFDAPIKNGKIAEDFRIKSHKETIDCLLNGGAKVLLVSHLGHDDPSATFQPVVEQIGEILGQVLTLIPLSGLGMADDLFDASQILLLDNVRQDPREEQNDKGFALSLSKGFDFYVNDAFAVCHREHASVTAITECLPSYAGLLIKKEIDNLSEALESSEKGKVLVVGGAKISTKLPVIRNFLDKAEKILVGGAVANDFFDAQNINVGASVIDGTVSPDMLSEKILLPEDILISKDKTGRVGAEPYPVKDIDASHLIVDIGPETSKHFSDIIGEAEIVIWNGPMGISEIEEFSEGTKIVAQAVTNAKYSVIGGGDTITAINKFGLLDKMGFVSTGGGAMLEFLAGNKLPGLEVLGY